MQSPHANATPAQPSYILTPQPCKIALVQSPGANTAPHNPLPFSHPSLVTPWCKSLVQPQRSAAPRHQPPPDPRPAHLEAAREEFVLHLQEIALGRLALEGFVDHPEGAVVLDVRPARVAVAER